MTTLVLHTTDALLRSLRRPRSDGTLILQRTLMSPNSVHPPGTFEHLSSTEIFRPDDSESNFLIIRAEVKSTNGHILDVVLKISAGSDMDDEEMLLRERDVYETHGESLASFIPKFFGLFETADQCVLCLVTEYCGDPLIRPLKRVERELNWKVINKAAELHNLGFHHGHLDPRNILHNRTTGEIRFIDLMALKPHACERKLRIKADCMIPDQIDFGCRELHELVRLSGLWKSNHLKFLDCISVYIPSIRTVEDVLLHVPPMLIMTEAQRLAVRKAAEEFVKMVPQMIPEESPSIQTCPASEDVI
ncbi:hypothetical protein Hypma_001884 [Hypsizygus marmoreus]|uniref:Protein kinase domain-containing protein n=1 Tax=Hypsizygus marmoreus TaxID=39966 RepID=A0A369J945_HYPMA|nr:hypothetical protein Hypma_001884 [Hypsizygus marmoreus]